MQVSAFAQFRYAFDGPRFAADSQTFDLNLGRIALTGNAFTPDLTYFFQIEGSTLGNANRISMIDAWMRVSVAPSSKLSITTATA